MIDPKMLALAEQAREGLDFDTADDFGVPDDPAGAIAALLGPQAGELIENGSFRQMAEQMVGLLLAPFENSPHRQAAVEILIETVGLLEASEQRARHARA